MERTSVFKNNGSQAVRLSAAVAFPESVTHVDVIALGRTRLVAPAGEGWQSWFAGNGVSDDFMSIRDQPRDANSVSRR